MTHPLGSRSMVHYDSTYIIAQAVGLTPSAAYWVAAYTEATDQGHLVPVGAHGAALSDPVYSPVDLTGINRYHLCAGGSEFHYPTMSSNATAVPFEPPLATYDFDAHGHLSHVRQVHDVERCMLHATHGHLPTGVSQWALGERSSLCINGLTAPPSASAAALPDGAYFSAPSCYCAGNTAQVRPFARVFACVHACECVCECLCACTCTRACMWATLRFCASGCAKY
jgi:hypothetical protein